jgi:hypothetical protein
MRIDEVDSRSLEQKLKDLISNPSTHPNIKATAEKKLADLLSSRGPSAPRATTNPSFKKPSSATVPPEPATTKPMKSTNFKANAAYASSGFKPNSTFSKKA